MRRRSFLAALASMGSPAGARAQNSPKVQVDGMVALRLFQAAIEGHVNAALRGLRAVAASGSADTGDWTDVAQALEQFVRLSPTRPVCWQARTDGSYVSTFDGKTAPDKLTSRPFFLELLAGQDVEGPAIISAVSGQRAVVIATPIMRRGVVQGAIGGEFGARAIMAAVDGYYTLPAGLELVVLNDTGLIVLHSEQDRIFQSPDLSEPTMANAVRRILAEETGTVAYRARGVPRVAVFNHSKRLGWRFLLTRRGD